MAASSVATCTVTGKVGAGNTVTAKVYTNISEFAFQPANNLFIMKDSSGYVTQVDITAATTVTVVLSAAAGNYTVTVS